MNEVVDILASMMNDIENDVIHSMQQNNRVATGKTIGELQTIITNEQGILMAPRSIDALEFGRKPTSPNAPAGEPTLYECIVEWAQARGIDEFQTNDKGVEVNVWRAITAHIHKYGFEGTPGILTEPLSDENLGKRTDKGLNKIADLLGHEIADIFNVLETV